MASSKKEVELDALFEDLMAEETKPETKDVVETLNMAIDTEEIPDAFEEAVFEAETSVMTAMGISDFITDVDDAIQYLTWVIYGKNGTGKTTLLSTTEGMLILAAEDGTLSIREKAKDKAKKIKIDTWDKLEQVYWLLEKSPRVKDKAGNIIGINIPVAGGKTFLVKSVGIDTVDRLVEVCMRNVILGERDKDTSKDVLKRTLKDWGTMGEKLKFWLQQFEELPIQRVWLCQEASTSDDSESDEFSIYPALNQGVRKYILADADIIARLTIAKTEKGPQFRLSALPNAKYVTKDRTTKLTGVIANPSLDKIYNAVIS